MIVDLHTRVWHDPDQLGEQVAEQFRRRHTTPWEQPSGSAEQHAAAMEPVAKAVIMGFDSELLGASLPISEVAEIVARNPEKFVGFAGIDPRRGNVTKRLDEAVDAGLKGVTVSPAAAGFHPTDTRAMTLFEACAHRQIPVHVEAAAMLARQTRLEFARPYLFDEVAREFPELKLVLGSIGDPFLDEGLALVAKHPTVYADLAGLVSQPWRLLGALLTAHQHGIISQLFFASGYPFFEPEQGIVNLYSINSLTQGTHLPSVPREQLRSIVERDALAVLGIAAPTAETEAKPAASSITVVKEEAAS